VIRGYIERTNPDGSVTNLAPTIENARANGVPIDQVSPAALDAGVRQRREYDSSQQILQQADQNQQIKAQDHYANRYSTIKNADAITFNADTNRITANADAQYKNALGSAATSDAQTRSREVTGTIDNNRALLGLKERELTQNQNQFDATRQDNLRAQALNYNLGVGALNRQLENDRFDRTYKQQALTVASIGDFIKALIAA
jgi:hypothetical protein